MKNVPEPIQTTFKKLKQQNIYAAVIGEFISNTKKRVLESKNGTLQTLPRPTTDQLWIALSQ
jgi:hydrogenase maturation factor